MATENLRSFAPRTGEDARRSTNNYCPITPRRTPSVALVEPSYSLAEQFYAGKSVLLGGDGEVARG